MMSASPAYRISKWVMIICHLRLPWLREQGSWDVLTILIIWIISPGEGVGVFAPLVLSIP